MEYNIRKARPDEVEKLTAAILAMALESEGRKLDMATLLAGVQAVFNNPALGTYWMMSRATDDQPIGNTLITTEWSDWNNAPYWWIQSLYIQPDCRGQGLFQQLIDHLEAEARREGVCEVRLYVERNNAAAIRAYEKSGFESDYYLCMTKSLRKQSEAGAGGVLF